MRIVEVLGGNFNIKTTKPSYAIYRLFLQQIEKPGANVTLRQWEVATVMT